MMDIKAVYISAHKYDYNFTRICAASVRYWYPEIDIYLIKDFGQGDFDTSLLEKYLNVKIFVTDRKKFGWGYGKLEPLFITQKQDFLILDSDTVLTGPVIEIANSCGASFVVDDEIQPAERFNEIYYNLDKIGEINGSFVYPGYSFNSGQWFGTSGILKREDFSTYLNWTEPPETKFPGIIFKGDQSVLNYVLHLKEQNKSVTISRIKLMIWPSAGNGDFISLRGIVKRNSDQPYIMHWAGIKHRTLKQYPRADILSFYLAFYNSQLSLSEKVMENLYLYRLAISKALKPFLSRK